VAAAPSNDKGECLPVIIWVAVPAGGFPVNNCLDIVLVVFLLFSFGGGCTVLLAIGSFRKFLLGVTFLVVESAFVGFAVGDMATFSLEGAALISAMDLVEVFCAVTTLTFFRLAGVATTLFDNFGDAFACVMTFGDSLAFVTGSVGTDKSLFVLALALALVEASLVSLDTVDLIRRSKTWYRFRK
jgi:hypothetical protein